MVAASRYLLRKLVSVGALIGASLALWGCSGKQVKFVIKPSEDANGRRPVYVLVRNVDDKTYLEESYQAVAAKVMAPDDTVLGSEVVFPGVEKEIEIDKPEEGSLGVYVLFTHPSGEWKKRLETPLPSKVEICLSGSRLCSESEAENK